MRHYLFNSVAFIFGAVLLIITAFLFCIVLVVSLVLHHRYAHLRAVGLQATATVVRQTGSSNSPRTAVSFRSADGTAHDVTIDVTSPVHALRPGAPVQVFYDPNLPSDVALAESVNVSVWGNVIKYAAYTWLPPLVISVLLLALGTLIARGRREFASTARVATCVVTDVVERTEGSVRTRATRFRVRYSFVTPDGTTYQGSTRNLWKKDWSQFHVDQPVTVVYSASNPRRNDLDLTGERADPSGSCG